MNLMQIRFAVIHRPINRLYLELENTQNTCVRAVIWFESIYLVYNAPNDSSLLVAHSEVIS